MELSFYHARKCPEWQKIVFGHRQAPAQENVQAKIVNENINQGVLQQNVKSEKKSHAGIQA
jgi:hypothetical protein